MKNQNKTHFLDDFFIQFSRIIFIFPIIILILGIWVKYSSNKNFPVISLSPSPTTMKTLPSTLKNQAIEKFNLIGPWLCQYQTKESSIAAFIQNKKILVKTIDKNEVKNFLIGDDCLYLWQEKSYTGERFCGIGRYLNLFESLPFFNFGDLVKGSEFGKNFDFNNLLNSCQKKEIKNELFSIPKNVIFKNLSTDQINK